MIRFLKNFYFLFLLLIGFQVTVFAQSSSWKSYTVENYSISYPADWEVNETVANEVKIYLVASPENKKDVFRENVNLMTQDVSTYQLDLDGFVHLSESQVTNMADNGKIIQSSRESASGKTYHRLEYTWDKSGKKLHFIQYYWVNDGTATILTFTGEEAHFKDYKKMSQRIMDSFTFQ